jgi:L-asparagine transporter-like permease
MFKIKKYQWNDPKLQGKAKTYDSIMLLAAILVVVSIYLLPPSMKMANIAFLVIGFIMWILSYRTKEKDRKLKGNTNK